MPKAAVISTIKPCSRPIHDHNRVIAASKPDPTLLSTLHAG